MSIKPKIGHNSVGKVAVEELKAVISRVERVEEDISGLLADKREIYAQAKAHGLDSKTIRQIVKMRKMDEAVRTEQAILLDVYARSLGMSMLD